MLLSDYRGGFELHNAEEVEKEGRLLEELEKLSLSAPRASTERPRPFQPFAPLLDIPVDGHGAASRDLGAASPSTTPPHWLLARSDNPRPPLWTDIGTIRSVHFGDVSLLSASRRGGREDGSPERSKDGVFTLQRAAARSRPFLSQVFGSGPDQQVGCVNGLNGSEAEQEYQLKTVSISKTKQSLGKCLLSL